MRPNLVTRPAGPPVAAIAQLASLLAATPEIIHLEVPGDGWSEMGEVTVAPAD